MSQEGMYARIDKAQRAIEAKKDAVAQGAMRQRYHFMPQIGWMNDPNGLIYFQGKYHVFFQYNPYGAFWDSMYWGHAVSRDLLHWEYLPPALVPSESYDDHPKGGCFSGSAIEEKGKLYLFYTGSTNFGNGMEQMQCMAVSQDGIHFEKYPGNPVLTAPEGVDPGEFRDPKVWRHGGEYYMLVGASLSGHGAALLYRSKDLFHWEFFNVLAESRGEWGRMWECPDLYPIGDKHLLTFSPVGSGDHTAVCLVGDVDYQTGRFFQESGGEMDWGLDYYAPQSFAAPDGRRIILAWANGWEWMPQWKDWGPTYQEGWCGFFSLPREVRLTEEGSVQYVPIRELEDLRTDPVKTAQMEIGETQQSLTAGDGISFEVNFTIDLEKSDAAVLELGLREGVGRRTRCRFDLRTGECCIDRNQSDGWSRGISRSILCLKGKKQMDVRLFSDQSSLEIFMDQCRNNHSMNIFAGREQNGLSIQAYGGRVWIRNYEAYGLMKG